MPIIPSATRMKRAIPRIEQPIRDVRTGGELVGRALAGAVDTYERVQQRNRQNEVDDAELSAAIAFEKERNAYDQDPDFSTISSRSEASMDGAIGTLATSISDENDREDFVNRQKLAKERVRSHLGKVAWGKERDTSRGHIDTQLTDAREAALTGDMGLTSELVKRRLDSAVAKNYYSAEEAAELYQRWQTSAATGKLEMMDPESRLGALDLPWADKLPSDVRANYRRVAEQEAIAGKAQSEVDTLMANGVPLDEGMDYIESKIKDPKLRVATEARFKEEVRTAQAAEITNENELYDKYSLDVMEGGKVDQIPREDWEALPTSMRVNLKNMESQSRKPRTTSDPAALSRVIDLSARGDYKGVTDFIARNGSLLSAGDREQYQRGAAEGFAPASVTDKQIIDSLLPGTSTTMKQARSNMLVQMNNWRNQYVTAQGKEPTPEQTEAEANRRIMDHDRRPEGIWPFKDTTPIYDLEDVEQEEALNAAHLAELELKDPENYKFTQGYMEARGEEYNRFDFEEAYQGQQYVTRVYRTDPAGYADVEAYFKLRPSPDGRPPSHSDFLTIYNTLLKRRK